jgi:hypothetical protein
MIFLRGDLMNTRSLFVVVVALLVACGLGAGQAQAGLTKVTDAEGNFSFTITGGGSPNSATLTFSNVFLTTINGSLLPTSIGSSFSTLSFTMTPSGTSTVAASGSASTTFGTTSGSQAELTYSLTNGIATNFGFLNLNGSITGLPQNSLPGYDFSPFLTGMNAALTLAPQKTGGTFADLISSGSGTITGTGGFTETVSVTPEPSTMAIFGIGLAGLFAVRRYYKRPAVA